MLNILKKKDTARGKEILNSLKALSDETRLRIINILSFGSFNVNEITEILGMGQSRISRHLKILSDAGLLSYQREGTWVYYNLKEDTGFSSDISKLLLSYREELPEREMDQKKSAYVLKSREEKSTTYFDRVGKNWDKIQKEVLNPEIYRNQILQYLPSGQNTILDLGCGPGGLIPHLLKKAKNVTGVDTSRKMLKEARLTYGNNQRIKFIEANLENLPFKNSSADTIIASMVLHHISNPPLVLQEANRILKNKGTLCLVDLKKHDKEFMRDNFSDLWLGFDPELLNDWLHQSGFEIKDLSELETHTYFKIITIKAVKKGGLNVRNN